mgnify:CR=1 FL=1
MDLKDKLAAGLERAAEEAEKALDKGKTKVAELQLELQMDTLAKKLGYVVFDFYRGRPVDQEYRQRLLDDLSRLEDRLVQLKAGAGSEGERPSAAGPPPAPEGSGAHDGESLA